VRRSSRVHRRLFVSLADLPRRWGRISLRVQDKELHQWAPEFRVVFYHGPQLSRTLQRAVEMAPEASSSRPRRRGPGRLEYSGSLARSALTGGVLRALAASAPAEKGKANEGAAGLTSGLSLRVCPPRSRTHPSRPHTLHCCAAFPFNIVITSYELALADATELRKIPWHALVVDEGHRLKNPDSRLFGALAEYQSRMRLLLTGTPLQNNVQVCHGSPGALL